MPGLVETFAATLGWKVQRCNVIVEGSTDVKLMLLAAVLYYRQHKEVILGDEIAILPAGKGDDGGVGGLNRRLNAVRQMSDADRGPDGSLRYRFIGLFDNDYAGRRAIDDACKFDRRVSKYRDLFLLHPVMPLASGADHSQLQRRIETLNAPYQKLDWEIEDLLSERLLQAFEALHPDAVEDIQECDQKKHWEFNRDGKMLLHNFVQKSATLEDLVEVVKLIKALRDYFLLKIDHIKC